jgi:hypothetical protein
MLKTSLTLLVGLMLIFVVTAQAQIMFEIVYDDDNSVYYSGRPDVLDTCGVWFEPPTDSKIISTRFQFNGGMGGDADVFIWAMADGFDPEVYFDSDESGASPGPTPLGTILAGPITMSFVGGEWEEINFEAWGYPPDQLDVGTDPFYVGWVLLGGGAQVYYPSILGDAGDDRPYHSLTYLTNPGGSYPNESGWWAYGIDWFVRTTVDMYGDPPPVIEGLEDWPDTYAAGPYTVSVTVTDQVQGGGPGVVSYADLVVAYDGVATDTISMVNVVGDTYEADIPAQPLGTMIGYQVIAEDDANHTTYQPGSGVFYNFTYLEPSGASILLVSDVGDHDSDGFYMGALGDLGYSYDFWFIASGAADDQGYPGTDVINTSNYTSILWFNGTANSGSLPDNDANLAEDPVAQYMDAGGNFFLTSSDYIGGAFNPDDWDDFVAEPGMFMYDYLWVESGWSDNNLDPISGESNDTLYIGVAADPISGDWSSAYIQDMPDPNYNDMTYAVVGATECFFNESAEPAGIHYDGAYRMVFLPWVLEALISPNVAKGILGNTLEWFGEATIKLLDGSRYGIAAGMMPSDILAEVYHSEGLAADPVVKITRDGAPLPDQTMTSAGGNQWSFSFPTLPYATLEYYVQAESNTGDILETPAYECWETTFTPGTGLLLCLDQLYADSLYDTTLTDILDGMAVTYDVYDVDVEGTPDHNTILANYDECFWVGFGDWDGSVFPMNTPDNPFTKFLMQGKSFLFSSEEMLGNWTGWTDGSFAAGNFAYDWLLIGSLYNDINYSDIQVSADPMCAGLTSPMTLGIYDPGVGVWTDYFMPTNPSDTEHLFFESPGTAVDNTVGFRDDVSEYNAISLGFCLFMMDYANREVFIGNVLDYFGNNPGTGVEPEKELAQPITYELNQNFPNPFNPVTNIRFAIPENAKVELSIYNLLGQEVARLVDRNMNAGYHSVTWNASTMSSGIYFYKIKTANFEQARKMILVK